MSEEDALPPPVRIWRIKTERKSEEMEQDEFRKDSGTLPAASSEEEYDIHVNIHASNEPDSVESSKEFSKIKSEEVSGRKSVEDRDSIDEIILSSGSDFELSFDNDHDLPIIELHKVESEDVRKSTREDDICKVETVVVDDEEEDVEVAQKSFKVVEDSDIIVEDICAAPSPDEFRKQQNLGAPRRNAKVQLEIKVDDEIDILESQPELSIDEKSSKDDQDRAQISSSTKVFEQRNKK